MLTGFKKFVIQGNVVDLAVGIVIGAAFGTLVSTFVKSLIDPIVGLILGNSSNGLAGLNFKIGNQVFLYGAVISAIITFTATAAAVYFAIVVPMNVMKDRRAAKLGEEPADLSDNEKIIVLLEQIAAK